jgi:ABC-2 type transport system permease protein
VVPTDARIYGRSNWPIIDELKKQYQVQQVKMHKPITRQDYDVLLVVQPSSLAPEDLDALLVALRSGMPAVIFEDPFPIPNLSPGVPPTSKPRRPPPGMEMYMQGPLPKCDISKLWRLLYVEFASDPGSRGGRFDQVVWQNYNPYPKLMEFANNKEFIFVDAPAGATFNANDEISSGLQHMLFPFPGFIKGLNALPPTLKIRTLVKTGKSNNGTIRFDDIVKEEWNDQRVYIPRNREYVLAAHIRGDDPHINVVLVADVDMLSPAFFYVRELGDNSEAGVSFDFDNVTFVLNALDSLADDNRFIQMRKHRPKHRTLSRIEERTEGAKKEATKAREKFYKDCDESVKREEEAISQRIEEVRKRTDIHPSDKLNMVAAEIRAGGARLTEKTAQYRQERDRKVDESETELAAQVDDVRNQYKLWAVLLPPIPPLVVAVIVFFTRRAREREGTARSRMR